MTWNVVTADEVAPQRWRNNGGWTRELLAWPSAETWCLRISVAEIEQSGAFSSFPGVNRWFGVLNGDGVRLLGNTLRAGAPLFAFDGDLAPECELLNGPTRDFNLMHRRGHGRLEVMACTGALPRGETSRWIGLFTLHGGQLACGSEDIALEPMSLAWREIPATESVSFLQDHCSTRLASTASAWWILWSPA
jgi:environmental stress-induced protein Ves